MEELLGGGGGRGMISISSVSNKIYTEDPASIQGNQTCHSSRFIFSEIFLLKSLMMKRKKKKMMMKKKRKEDDEEFVQSLSTNCGDLSLKTSMEK